jgi:hypothetical protein
VKAVCSQQAATRTASSFSLEVLRRDPSLGVEGIAFFGPAATPEFLAALLALLRSNKTQ